MPQTALLFSMLKLTPNEQDLLYTQAELKKLEDNSYLEDEKNENFQYIKGKFFANESTDKAKLLNVWSWIFGTVPNVYAWYTGNPSYDFWMNLREVVEDLTTLWFFTFAIQRVNGQLQLVYQPAKGYLYKDWKDNIIRFYTDDAGKFYFLMQEYGYGYIKNTLYSTPSQYVINGTEVPLDTIPQTKWMLPVIKTGIEWSALIIGVDQLPSITQRIKNMVYAIDRHIVMNHTQYLENVESFVLLKNINLPQKHIKNYQDGKKISFSDLWRIVQGTEDSAIEFVKNGNDLIDKCIEDNQNFVRRVSSITAIPPEFLGLETTDGAIWAWSRTLKQWSFIKKIQSIRDIIDIAIGQAMELMGIDEQYTRPDIFAKSSQELATELQTARSAKLISLYNAIKEYNDYTDEETELEQKRIQEEDERAIDLAAKSQKWLGK